MVKRCKSGHISRINWALIVKKELQHWNRANGSSSVDGQLASFVFDSGRCFVCNELASRVEGIL